MLWQMLSPDHLLFQSLFRNLSMPLQCLLWCLRSPPPCLRLFFPIRFSPPTISTVSPPSSWPVPQSKRWTLLPPSACSRFPSENPPCSVTSLQDLFCPLVSMELRGDLFKLLQSSSHPGICASRRLLSAWFVWPGLSRDVGLWARTCLPCKQSKI